MPRSVAEFSDVVPVDSQATPVSQGRDELAVPIEQPAGVDRGHVRNATVAVESDGVSLRCLLRGRTLVVAGGREVQDIAGRLVGAREVEIVGGDVNGGGWHLRWADAQRKRP